MFDSQEMAQCYTKVESGFGDRSQKSEFGFCCDFRGRFLGIPEKQG